MKNTGDPLTDSPKHNNPAQAPNSQAHIIVASGVKTKANPNNHIDMSLNLGTGGSKTDPLKHRVVSLEVGKGKDSGNRESGGRAANQEQRRNKGRNGSRYTGKIQGIINRDRRCYSNHRSNYQYAQTSRPNPPINQYKNTHTFRQKTLKETQKGHQRSQTQKPQMLNQRPKQKHQQTQKQAQKQKRQALALRQSRELETRYLIEEKFRISRGREYRIEYEGGSNKQARYEDKQDDEGVLDTYRLSIKKQNRLNTARTGIQHINNRIRYRKLLQTEPQAQNPQFSHQKSLNQYKNPIFNTSTSPQKGPNSSTSRTATRTIEYPVSGSLHRGCKNLDVVNVRDISVGSSEDQEYQLLKGLDVVDLRAYHQYLGDCVYNNHRYIHKQKLTKQQIIKKYQIIPTWHRSLIHSINSRSKPKTKQPKQKQRQDKSQQRIKFNKLQLQQEEECIDQSLNRQIQRQIQQQRERIKSVNRGAKGNGKRQTTKRSHFGASKEKESIWTKKKLDNIHITDAATNTKSKIASTSRNQPGTNTKLNILQRYKKSSHRINTIAACNQLSSGYFRQKNQDIGIKQKQLQTQLYDNESRQYHANLAAAVHTNTNHTISLYQNQVLESKIQRILSNSRMYIDNQKQRQSLKKIKKLKSKSKSKSKQRSKQKLHSEQNTPNAKYEQNQKYLHPNNINRNSDSNNISISRYADSANKQQLSPYKHYQIIKQSKLSQFQYMPKSQSAQRQKQSPYRSKALLQKQRQSEAKKPIKTQQVQALSPLRLHPKRKRIKTQAKSNHTLPANYSNRLDKSQLINSHRYQPNDSSKPINSLQQNTQREKYIQKIQNIISKSLFKKQSKGKNNDGNGANGAHQGMSAGTNNGYLINKYKF